LEPFWQRAILALFDTTVALVVAGVFAAWITERSRRRREATQQRDQLGSQMVEIANALYLQTQRHWRTRQANPQANQADSASRSALEEQYLKTRTIGEVIEDRLRTLFRTDAPRRHWHAVTDLLTVRYFQVTADNGKATDRLLLVNAGPEHSGLTVEQLVNPAVLLNHYREELRAASKAVFEELMEKRALKAGIRGSPPSEHDFEASGD
jgi:hypothetical protein